MKLCNANKDLGKCQYLGTRQHSDSRVRPDLHERQLNHHFSSTCKIDRLGDEMPSPPARSFFAASTGQADEGGAILGG
jgi:hypothetical protein